MKLRTDVRQISGRWTRASIIHNGPGGYSGAGCVFRNDESCVIPRDRRPRSRNVNRETTKTGETFNSFISPGSKGRRMRLIKIYTSPSFRHLIWLPFPFFLSLHPRASRACQVASSSPSNDIDGINVTLETSPRFSRQLHIVIPS